MTFRSILFLAILGLATSANAQLVVNNSLGALGLGSTNLTGDTTGANRNADVYPGSGVVFDESLGEIVYSFSVASNSLISITNNEGIFVGTDHDHFLLDGLAVTFDGTFNLADDVLGGVDEQGPMGIVGPGDYYLSIDTYALGGNVEGPYDVDLVVSAANPAPAAIALGTTGLEIDINTIGSDFDTEIGLFDALGNLVANNDDIGGGVLQSQLLGTLADPGTYYVAVGGFNSAFAPGFNATGGANAGNYNLAVNSLMTAGTLGADSIEWFSFDAVVPEPSSFSLLGMALFGALGFVRRRNG